MLKGNFNENTLFHCEWKKKNIIIKYKWKKRRYFYHKFEIALLILDLIKIIKYNYSTYLQ
jgi:hypothetical protein